MAELVFFCGLGIVAGCLARLLLARLPRGARVDPPYCELAVGTLWGVTGYAWAQGGLDGRWVPLLLGTGWLLASAGAVDVLHRRLPDALTLPAIPVILGLVVPLGSAAVARAATGAVALGAMYLVVHLAVPGALGAGDVKLAVPLGAASSAASWGALLVGALVAALFTALLGLLSASARALARAGPCWRAGVPHGPSMLVAGWLAILARGTGWALPPGWT
jgi:leader peptidase (prepilin peptidase)/N-methyltransferase